MKGLLGQTAEGFTAGKGYLDNALSGGSYDRNEVSD